jgi:hypothetical protein
VAGNYYPANTAASIKDSQAQLSLVFDRSVGAASLTTGALEVCKQKTKKITVPFHVPFISS